MRTIKFRGKNSKGKWLYGNLIQAGDNHFIMPITKGILEFAGFGNTRVIPDTVGQYTGLTDKNGKEIYEGDILKSDDYPLTDVGEINYYAIVEYASDDNSVGFYTSLRVAAGSKVIGRSTYCECDTPWYQCEVVGNIHDTPDLLEEAK